jgi:MFS family permease
MKDSALFALFAGGGIGVLVSYMFLYYQKSLPLLYNMYTPFEWRLWFVSMVLTVVSVIALVTYFSGYKELKDGYRELFIVSLSAFLLFAMFWSLSIFYIMQNKKDPSIQKPILYIVGLASIGMLISTVNSTKSALIILAACIVVFHHLIVDAIWWPMIHQRGYEERDVTLRNTITL